jgi:5'-nucleotidase
VLHGVPGIAVSHYRNRTLSEEDWRRAAEWVSPLLLKLMAENWEPATFWNINLPCLPPGAVKPEMVYCSTDIRPLPLSYQDQSGELRYQGNYHGRSRAEGSDVDVCFSGKIAISRLHLATR